MKRTSWIGRTLQRIRLYFHGVEPADALPQEPAATRRTAPAKRESPPPVAVKREAPPAKTTKKLDAGRRGRPVSSTLEKTIELLVVNPEITPAEIAQKLSVSRDYGRTLLRRARARLAPSEKTPAVAVAKPSPARRPLSAIPAPTASAPPASSAADEPAGATWPLSVPFPRSINLNRRAQVLRLAAKGEAPQAIAAQIGIPAGEVEFVIKMDRLLREAV